MASCPVCGMSIDEKSAKFKMEYRGKTYYFCSSSDKSKFELDPEKYVKA